MSDVAQVAPGVYTVPHRVVAGKMGLIAGSRRSVAVDCGSDGAEGQALLDLALAEGRAPDWIVYTHGHSDHAGGSAPFRGAGVTAIAHVAAQAVLRRLAEGRAAPYRAARPEEVAAGLLWPEVLFAGELRLDLGGRTARLIPAPGHSPDSACLFLEPDGILFAGDTAVSAIPPAFGDGSGRALEATLRHLAGLGAAVLVPGHGAVLRGAPAVRAWLTWLADYLSALQAGRAAAVRPPGPAGGRRRRRNRRLPGGRCWMRRCAWPRPGPCWATACPWTGPSVTGATATTPPGRWPRPSPALVQFAQSPGRAFG